MFFPWAALKCHHFTTNLCARGVDQKRWRLEKEESQAGILTVFQAYDRPLETVSSLKYLGLPLTAIDNDWPEVIINLQKARKIWARLSRILVWEGADTRVSGSFNLTIVQADLLFSTEPWVVTLRIGRLLGGFHHRVAQRI